MGLVVSGDGVGRGRDGSGLLVREKAGEQPRFPPGQGTERHQGPRAHGLSPRQPHTAGADPNAGSGGKKAGPQKSNEGRPLWTGASRLASG